MNSLYRCARAIGLLLCLMLFACGFFSSHAQATTLTFQNNFGAGGYTGMQTTMLFHNYPNNSKGGTTQFMVGSWVGYTGQTYVRGMLRTNLTSLAGSYSTITGARLKMKVAGINSDGGAWTNQPFNLYRVSTANKGWAAGNSTDAPQNGAACWNFLSYNSNVDPVTGQLTGTTWAGSPGLMTSGTDYFATPVATASVSSTVTAGTVITFTFSDLSFFSSWISNNANNSGFLIAAPTLEPNRLQWIDFHSAQAVNMADRPALELDVTGYATPPGVPINYNLASAGRVSINIYNSSGVVVRELLHAQSQTAGAKSIVWDGLNEQGVKVPNGNYTWKLLRTPSALTSEYIMSAGNTVSPDYDLNTGNNAGPRGLAVDSTGVYLAGAQSEGPNLIIKQNGTGNRLWTYHPWVETWQGGMSLASDGSTVYMMQQNGKTSRFGASTGNFIGTWNTTYTSGESIAEGNMYDIAAGGGKLLISFPAHNAVRWINPSTGATLSEVAVPNPQGVALDSSGDAYIISGSQIVKLVYGSSTLTTVVTDSGSKLVRPWRLTVETSGNLLVADLGTSQQVKRFNTSDTLLNTFGLAGGRLQGLYNGSNFREISAIASAPDGSFWITEAYGTPRRMAHFTSGGTLIKDFYGGQTYSTWATPDPADPTLIWMAGGGPGKTFGCDSVMQVQVDYGAKSWTVRAAYNMSELSFPSGGTHEGPPLTHGIGMNRDKVHVAHRGGLTYLYTDGLPQVHIVDESNRTLRAAVASGRVSDLPPSLAPLTGGMQTYLWVDANDDGQPTAGEMTYDSRGFFDASDASGSGSMDANFNYYLSQYTTYNPTTGPAKLPVRSFTGGGTPVYNFADFTYSLTDGVPSDFAYTMPVSVFVDDAGNTYGAYNTQWHAIGGTGSADGFWGHRIGGTRVVKWNSSGVRQWAVGRKSQTAGAEPGEMRYIERIAGVTHGCVVISEVEQNLLPVYDQDGLWVGRILDQKVADGTPDLAFDLGENFGGQLYTNPGGDVYYYGASTSSAHIFKVTGWSGWTRLNGSITVGAAPTALTATAGNAQVSLSWTGTGEASSYNVKRSTSNGGPYSAVASNVTGTTYTNTGLLNGTTYYYVVTANGINGATGNSNQASATPVLPLTTSTFQNGVSSYTGMQTNWLFQNYPPNNKGGDTVIKAGSWIGYPGSTMWRSLLRTNMSSLSGTYTSVSAARLKLKVQSVDSSGGAWTNEPFNLYRVSAANKGWQPGTSPDWPEVGSSCWGWLSYSTGTGTNWAGSAGMSTSGTDFFATPVATANISSSVTAGTVVTFTFSDVSFFNDWITNHSDNAGFLLKAPTIEPNSNQAIHFHSVNATNAADRPKLEVDLNH